MVLLGLEVMGLERAQSKAGWHSDEVSDSGTAVGGVERM